MSTQRTTSSWIALALAIIPACKGSQHKDQGKQPEVSPTPRSELPPPTHTARLAAGREPAPGCFAWSAQTKAAACITGERSQTGAAFTFEFVGTATRDIELGATVTDDAAAQINSTLASDGYVAIAGEAKLVVDNRPTDLGGGVSVTWNHEPTDQGGNNVAPSHHDLAWITCRGWQSPVLDDTHEGGIPTITVRLPDDDHAIIEVRMHVSREGESSDEFTVSVLDRKACKFKGPMD
ncbi:MAG: hypothetical protein H6Q90_2943 [Deltaproteobacteria bacterium]|nr:hypothetical protein [Deltaproteobacteria bacterium]